MHTDTPAPAADAAPSTATSDSPPPRTPGRPGVTRERFDEAWSALQDRGAGREPTLRELRRYLGSGSLSTLTRYRRLRAREAQERDELAAPGSTDAALLTTVASIVDTLAMEAAEAADARIAERRKQSDARVKSAETISDKARQEATLLTQRAEAAEAELERCREQLETSVKTAESAHAEQLAIVTENATLSAQLEALTQRLADVETQRLTAEAHEHEREQRWHDERQEHASALAQHQNEVTQSHSELAIARRETQSAHALLLSAQEQLDELQQRVSTHADEKQRWTAALEASDQRHRQSLSDAQQQHTDQAHQLARYEEQLNAERQTADQLRQQIQSQQSLLDALHEMNARITDVQATVGKHKKKNELTFRD